MARANGGDLILELMTTVNELKASMKHQSAQLAELSTSMKGNVVQFGRLAKLLAEFAQQTDDKFDEVDARLDRLEAASGK